MHSNIPIAVNIANPTEFASLVSGIFFQLSLCKSSNNEFIANETSPTGIINFGLLLSFTKIELVKFLLEKSLELATVKPNKFLISSILYFFSPLRA